MAILVGILGILAFFAVASDAFEVMLLPRRVRRQLRPVRFFFQTSWAVWRFIAGRIRRISRRDGFLSLFGPLSMVGLLTAWSSGLIFSFGLMHWSLSDRHTGASMFTSMYLSGATFFTLGYGDVVPKTPVSKALAVVESGAGLAFIAVTIGYLPVLYQLFSRRESRVIQLDTRAGSPPSAVTLLCRHKDFEALDQMQSLLGEMESWCSELIESHLSYPMLSYYRSQHDNQSWLAALAATLDCCALILTGLRGVHTFQARSSFSMARMASVEMCRVFHLKLPKKYNERLTEEGFQEIEQKLRASGLHFSDLDDVEDRLQMLRSTYEPYLAALSRHFLLALPPWSTSDEVDNWQRSRGGAIARDMVESAPARPD